MKTRLFIMVFALFLAVPVMAGHYRLNTVKFPFPLPVKKLQAMKISTTLDLWKATKTEKQRKKLAAGLHVSLKLVQRYHDFCDLLRVKGIGTKVAWVLQAAGIKNTTALAKADPEKLNKAIKTANKKVHVLGKLPGVDLVRWWIKFAGTLK